jgi:hypothetical protein
MIYLRIVLPRTEELGIERGGDEGAGRTGRKRGEIPRLPPALIRPQLRERRGRFI